MLASYARVLKEWHAMIEELRYCTCGHDENLHDFLRREPHCLVLDCDCERFNEIDEGGRDDAEE